MELDKYIKRKTVVVQIFLLISIISLFILSVISILKSEVEYRVSLIDFSEMIRTRTISETTLAPFYDETSSLEILNSSGDIFLRLDVKDSPEDIHHGFGIYEKIYMTNNTFINISWRSENIDEDISIHVMDNSSEDYLTFVPKPGVEWNRISIPISDFQYNKWWQPEDVINDGVFDLNSIQKLEVNYKASNDSHLDIRELELEWIEENRTDPIFFILLTFYGLFLFIRTILHPNTYINSIYIRIGFVLSVICITYNFLLFLPLQYNLSLRITFTMFNLFYLIDELSNNRLDRWRVLYLRYLLLYLVLYPLPLNMVSRLFIIQIVLYPALSKRDKMIYFITAITVVLYHMVLSYIEVNFALFIYTIIIVLLSYILLESVLLKGDKSQFESALTLYNGIFHHSMDFIYTTDTRGNLTSINRAFSHFLNRSAKELIGSSAEKFIPQEDRDKFGVFNKILERRINRFDSKIVTEDKSSTVYICETPILTNGKLLGHQILATDITERIKMEEELKEANRQLEILVDMDGLTQIANRRFFDKQLNHEVKRYLRSGKTLSLLFLDLDYYKNYNDFYGHQMGDDVLKMVASTINTTLHRTSDIAARYGGEEFAIILPDTEIDGAEVVAKRLINAVAKLNIPHKRSEVSDTLTISIGISSTIEGEDRDSITTTLLERADKGLYRAKELGRDQYFTWI